VSRIARNIVFFLALYLPLEDFLLKWVPVPYEVYLAMRQIPDALVIVAAGIAVGARIFQTTRFRLIGRGADVLLVLFVLSAYGSVLLQGGSVLEATLNLKALLRYVLVVYTLVNIPMDRETATTMFRVVYASVLIQLVVSAIQLAGPIEVDSIFLPRIEEQEVAGTQFKSTAHKEVERGYIFGTMTNTISYGGFLLVGLGLYLTRFRRKDLPIRYWVVVGLALFLSFMSGSRAVTIAVLLLTAAHQYMLGRLKRLTLIGLFLTPLIIPLSMVVSVGLTDTYFFEIFSQQYVDKAMEQRLGIILLVLPYFVSSLGSLDILFGLSADRQILDQVISDMFDVPLLLVQEIATIEDVYWAALLVYYGVVGFALLGGFFWVVLRRVQTIYHQAEDATVKRVAQIALLLFVVAIPLNFLGQFFEVRQFSFYLWTFVGMGLSLVLHPPQKASPSGEVSAGTA
jgi:LPXTG-motif cell wall-anchored protein